MKINVFLAEGFEEVEAVSIIDVLRRAELDVETISIMGNKEVKGAHGITIIADELFEDVSPFADVMLLPGGMPGTKYLGEHQKLGEWLVKHFKEGKTVGAICAAPSVLGALGILDGKKATCYPGFEPQLGKGDFVNEPVVVDGTVITSRGVGTALEFALKLVEILCDEQKAKNLHEGLLVPHYYG